MAITRRRILGSGALVSLASMVRGQPASKAQGQPSQPRGIIFMVADGMSAGVLPMAEAFSQQLRQRPTQWWQWLADPRSVHGLMDTASANSLVTDSAAASSAWSSGKRIPNRQINVDSQGRQLESIGETLEKTPVHLGLVTTSRITHATPAAFATNTPNRADEFGIAPQFLGRADILLGGGSKFFDPRQHPEGRDLFATYEKADYQILRDRDDLRRAKSPRLLGTFDQDHLPFSMDRAADPRLQARVPTLAEMTDAALDRFLPSTDPFLLQVEGARIDHAAHANDIGALLHDQLAFDDAVGRVLKRVQAHGDILVVLTSDHGNANPALNGTGAGYARTNQHFSRIVKAKSSHESLLAKWQRNPGGRGGLQKHILDGLGFEPTNQEAEALLDILADQKVPEWSHQQSNLSGLLGQIAGNHFGTGWTGVSHTADPTTLTAVGPGAERFSGRIRNDAVRHILLELLQV